MTLRSHVVDAGRWLLRTSGQRTMTAVVTVSAATAIAAVTAAGAGDPRPGLWAALAAVVAVCAGLLTRSRAVVLAGALLLIVQYVIASIGRGGPDALVVAQTGLMTVMIEVAHWHLEASDGTLAADDAARRALRVLLVAGLASLVGLVVLAVSSTAVDPVVARSVAVALLVAVWIVVIDLLRSARSR